jgi:AcrR family transcriptional regulator
MVMSEPAERSLEPPPTPGAHRAVRRALVARESAYLDDVRRLLDAGLEAMQESGDEGGPRVADIVRRAGLSNQAFYRHFTSKDDLVASVVEAGALRLVGYLEHQMSKEPTAEAKLRAWIVGVLSQAAKPAIARATRAVMWNLRQLPGGMASRVRPFALDELLVGPLRELGSTDPARDAATISTVVFGRLDYFLWESPPTDDDVEHLVTFCLRAIGG